MKEAVTKVIDTLTLEDSHGTFQRLMEQYNKCIAAGGDYFERDYVCTINKSAHTKKVWKIIVCTSYIFKLQFLFKWFRLICYWVFLSNANNF